MTNIYDEIADGYDPEDLIIRDNHVKALEIIRQHSPNNDNLSVIDLGAGHGTFLKMLHHWLASAELTGVDSSEKMMEIAQRKVPMRAIVSDIQSLGNKLRAEEFDLAVAHYVLAYVKIEQLLELSSNILASGGLLSLVTTTDEGGAHENSASIAINEMASHHNPVVKLLSLALRWITNQFNAPKDYQSLNRVFDRFGFKVIERYPYSAKFVMHDPQEAYNICIERGWYVHWLDSPGVPRWAMFKLARWICEAYPAYPVEHTFTVENLLLRRS